MTTKHRTTTTAALVTLLAATGAPTAGAAVTETHPATTANQSPSLVYSRPDKSVIRVTTPGSDGLVYSRPDKSVINVTAPDASGAPTASVPQAVVRVQVPQGGFDWGDAGIGAAGGVALAMLGVGGVLVASQQLPRRNRQTSSLS